YIIMDGGSTDETVEIVKKYEPWISHWVSEPDGGQSSAINKGWARSTGDVLAWLNSDDLLMPGALKLVGTTFRDNPDIAAVVGSTVRTDENLTPFHIKKPYAIDPARLLCGGLVPGQPSVFIGRQVYEKLGGVDESYHYAMDREYWVRISLSYPLERFTYLEETLSIGREWVGNKTAIGYPGTVQERLRILDQVFSDPGLSLSMQKLRKRAYSRTRFTNASLADRAGKRLDAWGESVASWFTDPSLSRLMTVMLFCLRVLVPVHWRKQFKRSLP
ncbi:MAG: glycosyltransferase family 2 protein, partial [Chloroflexi bacterium]|nr:glycosyltransferase family 2 protein [Chloroflexota bacterium]